METLTIGKVAKISGVNIETIRFYERNGLIDEPSRNNYGYRAYTEEIVQQIQFIRNAKNIGFTLNEIKELMMISDSSSISCQDIFKMAEEKTIQIKNKIKLLHEIQRALERLTKECSKTSMSKCAILKYLKRHSS